MQHSGSIINAYY